MNHILGSERNKLKITIRLFTGIICSVAAMGALFYFLLFWNPIRIHNANLLKWVPVLICFVALYISGRINQDTSKKLLPLLFIPFVIFDLFNFFYLPFILILFTVGTFTILLTRDDIQQYYRVEFAITIVGIFMYFLMNQPLILEKHNFGYNKDGEMVNATVLWDFSGDHPDRLPSHLLVDRNSNNYNLEDLSEKTYFVSFWQLGAGPV
ncbi:MAG: hypothetical protein GVY20_10535 [Bacteroidetes bacterium]|nr:hypothetical protein [Bacteroidota bacterium]